MFARTTRWSISRLSIQISLLSAEIGHYDLQPAYGESYKHGSVAISGSLDAFTWQLSYHATDNDAQNLFYESNVAPRLVLSLNLSF